MIAEAARASTDAELPVAASPSPLIPVGGSGYRRGVYSFTARVWEHEGAGAWHFLSVPEEVADEIEEKYGHRTTGFGAVKVRVRIGGSRWSTSLFPDKGRGTYVLPVKKAVRTAEGLADGSTAAVELEVAM